MRQERKIRPEKLGAGEKIAQAGKLLWVAIWYNMVTSVFYTALNVPYSSMLSFLSDDSEERSRLSLIRLVFAFSAMVVLNLRKKGIY